MASNSKQTVQVRLEVVNEGAGEVHQTRVIKLDSTNNYSVRIGRGSRSGSKDLYPAEDNAWFESRVMSREHAVLRAEPNNQKIYIEDVGSMHGTYVEGTKLQKYQPKLVPHGAELLFGAEVSRGPETFPALQIDVFYDFEDSDAYEPKTPTKTSPADVIMWSCGGKHEEEHSNQREPSHVSRNSFSVPEYDSEDYDSEAEQPLREVARKTEVVMPPRDAAVPESDGSNGGSLVSDDEDTPCVQESWDRTYCNTFKATTIQKNRLSADAKTDLQETQATFENQSAIQSSAKANLVTTPSRMEPQSSVTVCTIQGPTTKGSDHCYNVTDDEESEYGDDISAELYDEVEFNNYEKSRMQPDNSSFSSQSPILTSLPSKIELAAASEPVESAKPASTSVVTAKTPSDPSSMTDAPRAPSPSDAAMPKAKATGVYPFPPKYTRQDYSTESATETQMYNYSATNNRGSYGTSDWASYSPSMYYGVQDTYPQAYTSAPDYWAASQHSYYQPPADAGNYSWGYSSLPIKSVESAPKSLDPVPTPTPALASSFVTLKATPRVAIKDLVDEPQPFKEPTNNLGGFDIVSRSTDCYRLPELRPSKRKADQISDVEVPDSVPILQTAVAATLAVEQDAQVVDAAAPWDDSQSREFDRCAFAKIMMTTVPPKQGTKSPKSPSLDETSVKMEDERPKKKARSNFYKYATTAFGGIVVGAAGAVAALVALPPDFFV